MPFSNRQGQGFENKLAEIVAANLGVKLQYTWWSLRTSFVKDSIDEGRCDVLMGVPTALAAITPTRPYYRSTYVFVSRRDRGLHLTSLDDPRLNNLRIGIQIVGDDYAPPAIALARRGITANIIAFSLFGDQENAHGKIIKAVVRGDIDTAIVWGPFAGYFAKLQNAPLDIRPVSPAIFLGIPFTYEISIGVRKGNESLKAELDKALISESSTVEGMLSQYGVPQVH
ncbi:MAG: quinoprotein dehydrogenase-associated putative ABC transporter substrate-binding protein [Acidobacteriaceae bacterium]|nr:quinoprotein dehydrogenase-associated putative ABC transporter substrate-binding protein [Acidobacteriaceae bacterium]